MTHRDSTNDQRTNRSDDSIAPANDSDTNGSKRKAGAASIVVVGTSGSIDVNEPTADEPSTGDDSGEQDSSGDERSEDDRFVLVSMNDYRPGVPVRVVDRLPAPITVQLLRLPNDRTVPVLERPDEYTGYVVRLEPGEDIVYSTMIVFTRESLEVDATYAFVSDTQVFSTPLNLFRLTARRVDR